MFCHNCGNYISDGEIFCGNCGAKQLETAQPQPNQPKKAPIKLKTPNKAPKKPVIIVGAVAAIAVVAVGAVLNIDRVVNFAHKQFTSPAKYYQYVEGKTIENVSSTASNIYNSALLENLNISDRSIDATVSLEVGEGAKKYIKMLNSTGVDLTWIEDATISTQMSVKDDLASTSMSATVNKTDILTSNFIMDYGNSSVYMQVPEIAQKYIGTDLSNYLSSYQMSNLNQLEEVQTVLSDVVSACPSQSEAQKLISKYLTIAINDINGVTKHSTTISTQGVSQKCTQLTYYVGYDDVLDIEYDILVALKRDSDVEDIIKDVVKASNTGYDADAFYNEFLAEVDDMIEDIEGEQEDYDDDDYTDEIKISTYVNSKGEIIGRKFEVVDTSSKRKSSTSENNSITMIMPVKGGKFGFELSVNYVDGWGTSEYAELVGSGQYKSGKITGDFEVNMSEYDNEYELLNIGVSGLDLKQLKQGYINGTFEIETGEDLAKLDSDFNLLDDGVLTLDIDMSDNSIKCEAGVEYGGDDLGTLSVSLKTGNSSTIKIPDNSSTVMVSNDYDLVEWLQSVDMTELIKNLKSIGVPQEWLNYLDEMNEEIKEGNLYDLFW
jgi:hypothetical protein